jgi:flagellar M-ring protein FliF
VTSGSVGYEIFDTSNALGQTDFVQQLNRQRALQGELERTIQGWDGVKQPPASTW